MKKIKKAIINWRILLLLFFLMISLLAIDYQLGEAGIAITNIELNSSAARAGMLSPQENVKPTDREQILSINNQQVRDIASFFEETEKVEEGNTLRIKTNKREYVLLKSSDDVGIALAEGAKTNIRKGLDLQGGTRVVLEPKGEVSKNDVQDIIDVMEKRLNVYGLSDLSIRSSSDLEGNDFILIEIAGASKEEVKKLIASQGTFEAKIRDEIVFSGGKKDITNVCRFDGTCSGISSCAPSPEGYACRFSFEISLSQEAAKHHADITKNIPVNVSISGDRVLAETIDFYLDNALVDSLQISENLKGQVATNILISGPGLGATQQEAINDASKNMNELQTVLISGSLPTEVGIVQLDSISPVLGKAFTKNTLFVFFIALIGVTLILLLRYRSLKIIIPVVITLLSEIIIILGLATLFKNNLDLAAIAGIIAAVGTGVDHQIVILDEMMGKGSSDSNMTQKMKGAFFILFAAFATTSAAMLPLLWAGAGLLTGFALVTIAGAAIGVFITRPAFAALTKILLED